VERLLIIRDGGLEIGMKDIGWFKKTTFVNMNDLDDLSTRVPHLRLHNARQPPLVGVGSPSRIMRCEDRPRQLQRSCKFQELPEDQYIVQCSALRQVAHRAASDWHVQSTKRREAASLVAVPWISEVISPTYSRNQACNSGWHLFLPTSIDRKNECLDTIGPKSHATVSGRVIFRPKPS